MQLSNHALQEKYDCFEDKVPYLDLGIAGAVDGVLWLVVDGAPVIGLDYLKIEKIKS